MPGIKDEQRLRAVRDRLYARTAEDLQTHRHSLADEELQAKRKQASREWRENTQASPKQPVTTGPRVDVRAAMPRRVDIEEKVTAAETSVATPINSEGSEENHEFVSSATDTPESLVAKQPASKKRRYRLYAVLVALFVLLAGGTYTYFVGVGEISSRNIVIDVTAPGTIGAGEEVLVNLRVRNDNPVAIVSGTVIVQFPSGTRDADESIQTLRTSRITVDRIEPGAEQIIPVRAIIFGEEGEDKEIEARFSYRVSGTNSILERVLDPIVMQITSAPFSLQVETTRQVAAGQEVDVVVKVDSNAPNTLSDILISTEYPSGFEFIESDPEPVFGQNVWRINELQANGREEIVIRGMFIGGERDEFAMNFSAGLPREDNRFVVGSVFAAERVDFLIEQPFFNTVLSVNGNRGDSVAVSSGETSNIQVEVTNTLDSAVFDVRIAARLSGNALNPDEVQVRNGFYDSAANTVRFDVTTDSSLERIAPGGTRSYSFQIRPRIIGTAQVDIETDVFARRTSDTNAQEQLVGQTFITAQYTSIIDISRSLQFDTGLFTNTGPVPPVAEEQTTYTVTLVAAAGRNDLLDGHVEFSLPTYVEWLGRFEGPGNVEYNPVNQNVTWSIGSIDAESEARLQFQIAFNPSRSQIGESPVLVSSQRFRATDRFTGVVVRDQANVLSTELPLSSGFSRGNGVVRSERELLPEPEVAEDEED